MTDRSIKTRIYTDGACKGNPGPGGWGVFVTDDGDLREEMCGGESNTTNNRMELKAAIEAVRWYSKSDLPGAIFYLDSEYVRKGTTEWMWGWKAKGWVTSLRTPVKNADLWKELDKLLSDLGKPIDWRWVKGHSGDAGNEMADRLANKGAASMGKGKAQQRPQSGIASPITAEALRAAICKHLPGAGRYPDRMDAIVKELAL